MSKPSEAGARGAFAVALVAVTLLGPAVAAGGVNLGKPAGRIQGPAPATVTADARRPTTGGYQLRCWQDGRLLFEENHVALPDPSQSLRMSGTDRRGRPMYVTETRNATCLVRSAPDDRYWPR